MAQTNPNTIVLKADDQFRTIERLAGAALSPGYLLALNSSNAFVKHATANGRAMKLFAMEREFTGSTITTAYSSGDTVIAADLKPGDEVYAKLAASAAAIVIGDFLVSAGDGTLKKSIDVTAAAGTAITTGILADATGAFSQSVLNNNFATLAAASNHGDAIAVALEAVDNSAGGSEVFIKVKLL